MAAKDVEAGRAHVLIRLRDQVTGGLKKVERNFSAFGRSFATAGAALTAAGAGALAFPVAMAANMEQLEVSLEVMLGSAEAAKAMLKDLSTFAKKTPFGLQDVASNAQLLLNYGVAADQIMPNLQALGDVSAGNADKFSRLALAFGQTQAKGRLMGGEVMQMVEAGFNPLQEIARTTGKSVAELQKEMEGGQISAQMLTDAFASASGPGGKFNGMMEKQSNTAIGLWSTLQDAVSFGFKPLGDAAIAILKPLVQFAIGAADAFSAFMEANKGVAKAIAYVLIGMVAVGGILTVVGLSALALGLVIGGVATAITYAMTALATLFSPIGLAVLGFIALGMAAYYFRDAIYAALVSVAAYFQPLTDAIGRVWSVFSETFSGIVGALLSGQLTNAAGIAWLGFVATAWQAIAELGGIMEMAHDMIASIAPGVGEVITKIKDAFASIGQAILAGRWDLAAAIGMAKVRLAVETGLNVIRSYWTGFTAVLGDLWDTVVFSIRSTWRTAVTEIAKSFVWVAQQFGMTMDGVSQELDRMAAADQATDDKAKARKQAERYNAGANILAANKAREDQLRQQIGDLEAQSAAAFAEAGAPTIEDVASKARDELKQAIAFSEAAAKKENDPKKNPELNKQAGGAADALGKITSAGTFSAAGAAQALGVDTTAAHQTAANTKKIVQLMQQQKASPLFT